MSKVTQLKLSRAGSSQTICHWNLDHSITVSYCLEGEGKAPGVMRRTEHTCSTLRAPACYYLVAQLVPWAVTHQAPLSMGFPRQEYWSGLPFPSPGGLPDQGMEPAEILLNRELKVMVRLWEYRYH